MCIADLKEGFSKTKEFAQFLGKLGMKGKILAVLDGSDESVGRASRNIPSFNIMRAQDINAYDIMRNKNLLVTKTAFQSILKRVR
jgi:large subunit ribosomal protein L4